MPEMFQKRFIALAEEQPEKLNTFANSLVSNVNSVLTEFRVGCQSLDKSDERTIKKTALMYDLSCKLLRIIEIVCLATPQVFLGSHLNIIRLAELILLALATVQTPPYDKHFAQFLGRTVSKQEFLQHRHVYSIYGPITGILVNLHSAESDGLHVDQILAQVDGALNVGMFENLSGFPWAESGKTDSDNLPLSLARLETFLQVLKKTYEARTVSNDQAGSNDDDDDDNLCPICFSYDIDVKFVPCDHRSCRQYVPFPSPTLHTDPSARCIMRHLIEHKNCFFCNAIVEEVIPTASEEDA